MESALTGHVRQLAANSHMPTGFEDFWKAFTSLVKRELKRRGLWAAPTCFLGIPGSGAWTDGDALDDLCRECYRFAILDRLDSLERHLTAAASIDHAIRRNVANCFTELQRRNDPVGYAAFRNTEAAIAMLIDHQTLTASGLRAGRIRNETVLSFRNVRRDAPIVVRSDLLCALTTQPSWSAVLPRLVRCELRAQMALAGCVSELVNSGIHRFRFDDLAATVKHETREHWTQLHARTSQELDPDEATGLPSGIVPLVPPDGSVEERDSLMRMIDCIHQQIGGIRQRKVRSRITEIVRELLDSSQNSYDGLSLAELARRLDVSTSTLHDSVKILREIAEYCRTRETG
jgi:hypothetical protein